ncbi:MAG: hypothetical protein ACYDHN_09930, partial [Solirubrobacteraceae bacterium]
MIFTDEALGWIEDPELRPFLAVSRALYRVLEDREAPFLLASYGEPTPARIGQVREAVRSNELRLYSYEESFRRPDVSTANRDTLNALLAGENEPLAAVLADEWAFVTTESLISFKDMRRAVDAFVRAGAKVYEATREEMERGLEAARDLIPAPVLRKMKQFEDTMEVVP